MLTVIAIIALLATLTLAVIPGVREKRDKAVARAQLRALTVAINDYKTDLNEYPPDNTNDVSRPPLFYELTGVSTDKAGRFTNDVSGQKGFSAQPPFAQSGFRNTRADGSAGKNYYAELKPRQYAQDASGPPYGGYWFIVVPVRGPNPDFNPFHYNSSNPANNPNSYDLWVDITPRGNVIRIDNWSKN
jgi:type II secretory pathway pseudopilin PulG